MKKTGSGGSFIKRNNMVYALFMVYSKCLNLEEILHKKNNKNAFKIVTGNPKGRRTLERQSHRWEDNIKMDL